MRSSAVSSFHDPHDYQAAVRAGDVRVTVTGRGEFGAELTRIDLDRLWMQSGRASLPMIAHSRTSAARTPILFGAAGESPLRVYGKTLSRADIVLLSPAAEYHLRIPGESHWLAMSLAPQDLAAAGRTLAGRELRAPPVTRLLRPREPLLARLRNLHASACHLAATAPDILHHSEVGKAMEQELIRTMVACLASNDSVRAVYDGGKRAAVMHRFERALEEHEGEPLYLLELCAELDVSDRQLRLYCQEQLGMSPHRYLWLRRMHMARRALALAHASATTVTSIATGHGFGELGRFAVQYRRLFGESPSATLARSPDEPRKFSIRHLPASVSA